MEKIRIKEVTLINTAPCSTHYVDVQCSCGNLIATAEQTYRHYNNSIWVYSTRNTKCIGKRRFNKYKRKYYVHLHCKRCKQLVGHYYPDGPSNDEVLPLTKLFYVSRGETLLVVVPGVEATGLSVMEAIETHTPLVDHPHGYSCAEEAYPIPQHETPGKQKFNAEKRLLRIEGKSETPENLAKARRSLYKRNSNAHVTLEVEYLRERVGELENRTEELEDSLSCPICIEVISERGMITPCRHTLCVECCQTIFTDVGDNDVKCPICREAVDGWRRVY